MIEEGRGRARKVNAPDNLGRFPHIDDPGNPRKIRRNTPIKAIKGPEINVKITGNNTHPPSTAQKRPLKVRGRPFALFSPLEVFGKRPALPFLAVFRCPNNHAGRKIARPRSKLGPIAFLQILGHGAPDNLGKRPP